ESPAGERAAAQPPRTPVGDDGDDPRPSQPSSGQSDYAPARGGLWLGLGVSALCMVPVALCLQPLLFGLVTLGLSLTAMVQAGRDLKRIQYGDMDPQGRGLTLASWIVGIIGTALGGLLTICGAAQLVLLLVALSGKR